MITPRRRTPALAAAELVRFWFEEAGPSKWFRGGPAFDEHVRRNWAAYCMAAARGELSSWASFPVGALALVLLLDQLPRNIHRGGPAAFATDPMARKAADAAIARRFDLVQTPKRRAFFYMPFMHSEALEDQDCCVALFTARAPQTGNLRHAIEHRAIISRFGRFPHRNAILGRVSTPEERQYLGRPDAFRG